MKRGTARNSATPDRGSSDETLSKEEILNSLHELYVNSKCGLLKIGRSVGLLDLFAPRRKVNIMLMGNHSSGKSSFINWYISNKVQKTGVAIETQGFTLVTCARQRESLTGTATLRVFPYMKPLEEINGVVAYLNTELVPTKSRSFNLVTFIDTPGLADGQLSYPYDIEKAILWLGNKVDIIFVFFDPIGQALCKRTLSLVEILSKRYSEKMKFFLSKADEAGTEVDRQKVMMQIVQELCKRPGLDQSGFEMLTIYIPDHAGLKHQEIMCTNQIDDACQLIDKTIALTIQKTFDKCELDINEIEGLVDASLKRHQKEFNRNWMNIMKLFMFFILALHLPLSYFTHHNQKINNKWYQRLFDGSPAEESLKILVNLYDFITYQIYNLQRIILPPSDIALFLFYFFFLVLPLVFFIRYKCFLLSTLKRSEASELKSAKYHLEQARAKREELFSVYLNQMLHENDTY